jgi:hypothetical protein
VNDPSAERARTCLLMFGASNKFESQSQYSCRRMRPSIRSIPSLDAPRAAGRARGSTKESSASATSSKGHLLSSLTFAWVCCVLQY